MHARSPAWTSPSSRGRSRLPPTRTCHRAWKTVAARSSPTAYFARSRRPRQRHNPAARPNAAPFFLTDPRTCVSSWGCDTHLLPKIHLSAWKPTRKGASFARPNVEDARYAAPASMALGSARPISPRLPPSRSASRHERGVGRQATKTPVVERARPVERTPSECIRRRSSPSSSR